MLIGYVRVSTNDQNTDLQRNAKVVGSTPIIGTIKINKLHIISTFLIF